MKVTLHSIIMSSRSMKVKQEWAVLEPFYMLFWIEGPKGKSEAMTVYMGKAEGRRVIKELRPHLKSSYFKKGDRNNNTLTLIF